MRMLIVVVLLMALVFIPVATAKAVTFDLDKIYNTPLIDDSGCYIVLPGMEMPLNATCVIKLDKYPERIVSIAPSETEILFAIGAGDKVIGVTEYCNYPPEVVEKKESGELEVVGGYWTVDIEKVMALNPDVVIACGNPLETIEELRYQGLNVIAFDSKVSIERVMEKIIILGSVTGHYEEAKDIVADMANRIEEISETCRGLDKVRAAHVFWYSPIWVSGNGTYIDELIELASGENVFSDIQNWGMVNPEDFLIKNPEVIIISGMGEEAEILYNEIISNDLIKYTDAVKNGRVYIINPDIIERPSYRLAEALQRIAECLHPEAFGLKQAVVKYDTEQPYGKIGDVELINAIMDWLNNKLTDQELIDIIMAWLSS